ncbi:MAG: hypothetical protein JWO20_3207 [Candidatus Angelobacter sp.]|nr:hypothetical protein [Candidatus Angelobacter sp.]
MAAHDWVMARLDSTVNPDNSLRLTTPKKTGLSLAAAASGGSISGKMRDISSLWRSGLSANLLCTNISDPFTDETADLEVQNIVARFFVQSAELDGRRNRAGIQASQNESEIMKLVQFQSVLQTSARALAKIARVSSGSAKREL